MLIPNHQNDLELEQLFEPKQDVLSIEELDIFSSRSNLFSDIDDKERNLFEKYNLIYKNDRERVTSYIDYPNSRLFPLFKIIKVKNRPTLENEINELIKKMNLTEKDYFLSSDNNCEEIQKIRNKLIFNKKRTKKLSKELKPIERKKQGRKKKDDSSKRNHNRFSSDNIIKAIKTKINDSLILFINNIIKIIYNPEQINNIFSSLKLPKIKYNSDLIKKNNRYNLADSDNKFCDSNLLNCTIKEYFSSEISIKYKNFQNDYNKLIINYLLNDDNYKNIFNFIFNIKIDDWLNILIYKKEINDLNSFNTMNEIEINIIQENLVRIDEYLKDIYGDDKVYYHCFMLLIYNFKRYFDLKEKRNSKKIKIINE